MRKLKTSKSVSKRFKVTKKGKIKRAKAFTGHLLSGKKRKRKRSLKRGGLVEGRKEKETIRKLLPYG